jgi:hypothetical protein
VKRYRLDLADGSSYPFSSPNDRLAEREAQHAARQRRSSGRLYQISPGERRPVATIGGR